MDTHSPLLIDAGRVTDPCCVDAALELLTKSLSNPPNGDLWAPHHSPFIQALIERFTQFGLTQIATVNEELNAWLAGERSEQGAPAPAPAPGSYWSLSSQELGVARLFLAHLPLEHWSLWDYNLLIEYLMGRYLPAGALRNEAEKYAVQTSLMGKVQAMVPELTLAGASSVVAALPTSVVVAKAQFRLPAIAQAVMDYGYVHCAEQVTSISDAYKHKLKTIVMEHQSQVLYGEKPATSLQSKLLDAMGDANKDWRNIALTEAGELANQGLIAALTPGERVRRQEAYKGACPFCRKIDNKVFDVVPADAPDKDGETQVWPGKTNIGRSASPMKRGPLGLVERTPDELWWPAAGVQHPHCRGTWHREVPAVPGVSDEFKAWLEKHLAQGRQTT